MENTLKLRKITRNNEEKPKTIKILILIIFLLAVAIFFLPSVLSVPPVQTTTSTTDQTLSIAYPQYQYAKLNTGFVLNIHVYNSSKYITGTMAGCYVDLYNPMGVEICHNKMLAGSTDYYFNITSSNFSNLGLHSYIIQCNTSSQTGFANGVFEVTNNGVELTSSRAMIDIGLLIMLVIFFIISIYIFVSFDNLLNRFGMFGISYLLLIAITFVAWNMAYAFLISAPFIADMFRILFFVLIAGLFPLVIGGFAYYVIMMFKIKEIERLMEKGFSYEDAERRTGSKYK